MSTVSIDKIKADGFTVPSDGIAGSKILVLGGKGLAGTTVGIYDKIGEDAPVHLGDAHVGANGFWSFTTAELSIDEHKFFAKGTDSEGNTVRSDRYVVEVGSPLLTEADIKFTYADSEVNVTIDPNHQHLNAVSVDLSMFGGKREAAATLGDDGKYHASYTVGELPDYTERPLLFAVSATASNGVGSTTVDNIPPELTDAMIKTTATDNGVVKVRVAAIDLLGHAMDHVKVDLSLFGGGTDVDVPLTSEGNSYFVRVANLDTSNLTDKYVVVTAVDSAGNENGFVDLAEAPIVSLIGVSSSTALA